MQARHRASVNRCPAQILKLYHYLASISRMMVPVQGVHAELLVTLAPTTNRSSSTNPMRHAHPPSAPAVPVPRLLAMLDVLLNPVQGPRQQSASALIVRCDVCVLLRQEPSTT